VQILILYEMRLKMPIHALNMGILDILPLNAEQSHRSSQNVPPCEETRHMTY